MGGPGSGRKPTGGRRIKIPKNKQRLTNAQITNMHRPSDTTMLKRLNAAGWTIKNGKTARL